MPTSGLVGASSFLSGIANLGRTLQSVTGAVDTNGNSDFKNFTTAQSKQTTAHSMKEFARAAEVQRNDITMATDRQIMEKSGAAAKLNF